MYCTMGVRAREVRIWEVSARQPSTGSSRGTPVTAVGKHGSRPPDRSRYFRTLVDGPAGSLSEQRVSVLLEVLGASRE